MDAYTVKIKTKSGNKTEFQHVTHLKKWKLDEKQFVTERHDQCGNLCPCESELVEPGELEVASEGILKHIPELLGYAIKFYGSEGSPVAYYPVGEIEEMEVTRES